ncbi:MAG: hypothetical protein ACKO6C_01785 [Alphaproteobacteria bacterium]
MSKFLRGLPGKIIDLCEWFAKKFEDDHDKTSEYQKPRQNKNEFQGDGQTYFPGPGRTPSVSKMTVGQLKKVVDPNNIILTKGPNHEIRDPDRDLRSNAKEELQRRKKKGTLDKGR